VKPHSNRKEDRHRARRTLKPFAGVDGEGGNVFGRHEYMLLRAGREVVKSASGLTWEECLRFLTDLPRDKIYVSFFFDYDVTKMLQGLPSERLRRILDRDSRPVGPDKSTLLAVDIPGFQVDYLPGKEFRIRRKTDENSYGKWLIINDVGSFFQTSFVSALRGWFGTMQGDRWIPETEQIGKIVDRIAEGKEQRNSFGKLSDYEDEYNLLEIVMLENLMERFRSVCLSVGLKPARWQGPGNLVVAQFRRVGLPRSKDVPLLHNMPDLVSMANDAFYGGRFEASYFGEIPGPIYQYDINSAYAATYRSLPCLLHGEWEWVTRQPEDGIYVGNVGFEDDSNRGWGPFPIRTKLRSIVFPRKGRGCYFSPEIDSATRKGVRITWEGGYRYHGVCGCQHFNWVEPLFEERKRLGKDARGKVLKLVLASTYGKLAQSVGRPPYANPIWASYLLSKVRAQLGDAALDSSDGTGSDVVMLATDGLFSREPRNLPVGNALGEWECTVHDGIFVVQSGVYFLPEHAPKTRGVPQRKVIQHTWDFWNAWQQYLKDGVKRDVVVELNNFIGLRLGLAWNRPEDIGQWLNLKRSISFDWTTKRVLSGRESTFVTTVPPLGGSSLTSVPYSRNIGGFSNNLLRAGLEDRPDWADEI